MKNYGEGNALTPFDPLNINNPEEEGEIFSLSNTFNSIGGVCCVEKVSVLALAVNNPTTSIEEVDEPVKLIVNSNGVTNVNEAAASKFTKVSKLVSIISPII